MSDSPKERTNLPAEGAKIEPRGYHLGLAFHPPIKLDRKKGIEYAATLSDYIDPSSISLENHGWTITQPVGGTPRSQLRVAITSSQVQVEAVFPTYAKEWFEQRQLAVLENFGVHFEPDLILHSAAMIRGVLPIDGDARSFLAHHVMNIGPERIRPLARPIHVIGLRFVFPPFQKKGEKGPEVTDWLVDVKAESLGEDPSKLFLEADARWPRSMKWNKENLLATVARLGTVSEYLEKNVADFLRRAASGETEPN